MSDNALFFMHIDENPASLGSLRSAEKFALSILGALVCKAAPTIKSSCDRLSMRQHSLNLAVVEMAPRAFEAKAALSTNGYDLLSLDVTGAI